MIRSHKIALDPNDRQTGLLMQHCGWARVASNWAIDAFRAAWFTGEGQPNAWLTDMDLRPMFNAVKADLFPWSRSLSQAAAKNAIIHTCKGFKAWGASCKARKAGQPARRVGFPRYRKRGRHMSYTASNGRNTVRPVGRRVRLPGVGWVNMREPLRFEGDVTSVTVRLQAGRWHAAFTVDTGEPEPAKRAGETVGIDMGLTVLATLSDETRIRNPKVLAAALAELRSLDKALARSRNTHGKNRPSKRPQPSVRTAQPSICPRASTAPRSPPQGHLCDSQDMGRGEGRNAERERYGEEQAAGAVDCGCRHSRVCADVGIQVRVARRAVCEGGSVVSQQQNLQRVRGREGRTVAVRTNVSLRPLRLRVRPGFERGPEHPGVSGGRFGCRQERAETW